MSDGLCFHIDHLKTTVKRKVMSGNKKEVWKPVKGYEGLYEISNLGGVKSLRERHGVFNRTMKPAKGDRYFTISFTVNGERKTFMLHRVIAMHFIPNPDNKPYINHIDCNGFNNDISNLEWVTHKENMQYAARLGRMTANGNRLAEFTKENNINCKKVNMMNLSGETICVFDSIREASKHVNVHNTSITLCCKGYKYRKTAGGYKWNFADV